ncbi:unnamed protein product [Miscanthus lutarioriparius]|uniref:Uncharacterized protein n=1 Tax=Miscanthus lutarioriparius TaxID=422564 RepID=A0A811PB34_9POAL|nr:unnamed protein product [Miscanthus lutarioriparius]
MVRSPALGAAAAVLLLLHAPSRRTGGATATPTGGRRRGHPHRCLLPPIRILEDCSCGQISKSEQLTFYHQRPWPSLTKNDWDNNVFVYMEAFANFQFFSKSFMHSNCCTFTCLRHSKHQELKDFSLSIGILQVGCKISPGMADLVNKLKARNVDVFLVSGSFRQMIKAKLLPNGQDNVNVSFCKLIDLDYGFRRNN